MGDTGTMRAMADEIKWFVGKKVTRIVMDPDGGCVGFQFGKKLVWFMSDPECNVPGFPSVEEDIK